MERILALLLFTGCVHAPTTVEVSGPNGEAYSSICRNIADCYNEAYRVCGGEYTLLDSSSRTTQQILPNNGMSVIINHSSNQILYSCKD